MDAKNKEQEQYQAAKERRQKEHRKYTLKKIAKAPKALRPILHEINAGEHCDSLSQDGGKASCYMSCPGLHHGGGNYLYSQRLRIELRDNYPYLYCSDECSKEEIAGGLGIDPNTFDSTRSIYDVDDAPGASDFNPNAKKHRFVARQPHPLREQGLRGMELVSRAAEERSGRAAIKDGTGWLANCPVHGDHKPSLKIDEKGDRVLIVCRSRGCKFNNIVAKLGLSPRDFFLRK